MSTREEIIKELGTHFRLVLEYKGVDSSFADSLAKSSLYLLSELGVVIKAKETRPPINFTLTGCMTPSEVQRISVAYHEAYKEYVAVKPLVEEIDEKDRIDMAKGI